STTELFTGKFTVSTTTATSTIGTGGFSVGTSQLVVDRNTGNVGIGTTNPTTKLAIATTAGYGGELTNGISILRAGGVGSAIFHYLASGVTNDKLVFLVTGDGGAGTTPVDLAQAKMVIEATGNVGIGTTAPAQTFHVVGHCMTGDTLIAVRRRKKYKNKKNKDKNLDDENTTGSHHSLCSLGMTKEIEYEYLLVRIDEIQPGDEVLSLNEANNSAEYHKVRALMDMGVREIFELRTKSGRIIRTTEEHPYLVKSEILNSKS
ncbi:hypothetical protein L6278_02000, partial [Candidatus Parcubacteria bacterium]|nr:hypothetical protein [Patescibacteria group bacterium]MBU4481880.1 hypothetical protein [Patescibacteria group bacterium]MCG2686891.1 hypothetical protein [Candidatus Parcubacteria bacterium]